MRLRVGQVAAAIALCAWCGWVSGYHRTSVAAEVTWVVSTVAVIAAALALAGGRRDTRTPLGWRLEPAMHPWPRPGRGGSWRALAGMTLWLALVAVALTWDVLGIDTGPHQYHPTISALAQAYRPLNAGLLLVWMLLGVGYAVARARAPISDPGAPTTTGSRAPNAGPDEAEGRTTPGAVLVGLAAHRGSATVPGLLLPSSVPVGIAFWLAVPIAAVAIDVTARRSAGRMATGEELVRFISTAPWAKVLLGAAWLLAGYHLFAR